jgi:hypothetical protein
MSDQGAIASLQAEVNRLQAELSASQQDQGEMIFVGEYLCQRLIQLGVTVRVPLVYMYG